MPTSLPTVEEMLEFANKRFGIEIPQLKEDIAKYGEKHAKLIRSDRLMTFLYLKTELGIVPKIATVAPSGFITLDEMKKSVAKSKLNTQGYLIRKWDFKAGSDKNDAIGFIIMDKTGSMLGMIFYEDALKKWREVKLEIGDFVKLQNISVKEWEGDKNMRVSGRSEVQKAKKPAFPIEELIIPISQLVDGQSAMIQITVLNNEETAYVGCPYCFKRLGDEDLKVQQGQEATCPKDGRVLAESLAWIRGTATDGEEDIDVSFPPSVIKEVGKPLISGGGVLNVAGTRNDGEFSVDFAIPVVGFGTTAEELKKRFETGSSSVDTLKNKIPMLLKSWDGMQKKDLVLNCKQLFRADEDIVMEAVEALTQDGKITEEKPDFFKVV